MARGVRSNRPRIPARIVGPLSPADPTRDRIEDDALLRELAFDGVDLSASAARLVDIESCTWVSCRLADSEIVKLSVSDTRFERCDLANLRAMESALNRVEMIGCRLTGTGFATSSLRHLLLRDCVADLSSWRFSTTLGLELVDCRLQRADFASADLRGAMFRRCDLTGAELSEVQARGAVFVDCTWDGVRGVASLAGATVASSSPVDELAFAAAVTAAVGVRLGDPADHPEPGAC